MKKALLLIWLLLALCLPWSGFSSDENALQVLVDNALAGSTVLIPQGVYRGGLVINKPLVLRGLEKETTIIEAISDSGDFDVIHLNASNVHFSHFTIQDFWLAVRASSNCVIEDINFKDCKSAISCCDCHNVTLRNNKVWTTYRLQSRVHISSSSNVTFANNNITNTDLYFGHFNHDSLISGNTIAFRKWGLILQDSWNNTITRNTFHDLYYGLECSYKLDANPWLPDPSNNLIYFNNFIDNWVQARISFDAVDRWDNGTHGNYWSDYKGEDLDSDGIGDSPYYIGYYNRDYHPLMTDPPPGLPVEEKTMCQFYYGLLVTVVTIKIVYPNGYVASRSIRTVIN